MKKLIINYCKDCAWWEDLKINDPIMGNWHGAGICHLKPTKAETQENYWCREGEPKEDYL